MIYVPARDEHQQQVRPHVDPPPPMRSPNVVVAFETRKQIMRGEPTGPAQPTPLKSPQGSWE